MRNEIAMVVDCRLSNIHEARYYTLNLWGKPCFEYVCEAIMSFTQNNKYLLTDSPKIKSICSTHGNIQIITRLEEIKEDVVALISGTAVLLNPDTIKNFLKAYRGG